MFMLMTVSLYVKKYWAYGALAIGIIFGIFFFRKEQTDFADSLKKIQDVHDEEIKKIQNARIEEQRQHEVNLKKIQDTLDLVQRHYDNDKKELDEKKRLEIESLVKQYSDNPDVLAQKLSEATGFVIVMPS